METCTRCKAPVSPGYWRFEEQYFDGDRYVGPIYCVTCAKSSNLATRRQRGHARWCDCERCQ